jgi:signal transduction histidine kinase/ligand-binding sensor domain-containing protein/DNA-binding response OmpR family regulator
MIISKKTIVFAVLILQFLLSGFPGVTAQNNEITFKHLSTVDGLSNFTVLAIAQDHRGFMWFGTVDGLNRYDGKNIKIYKEDPDVPYSLGSSYIWSLLTAGDSGMWVGSDRELYYYDYYHDNFHLIPILDDKGKEVPNLSIRSFLLSEKILWIGTNRGLFRYDLANMSFIPYDLANGEDNRPVGKVIDLQKSANGTIWIGDSHGLLTFQDGTFTRISIKNISGQDTVLQGLGMAFDSAGRVWFGTDNADMGIIVYDPVNKSQIILSQQDGYLPHNRVKSFFRFQDGDILLGTLWGLGMINETTYENQHFLHDPYDPGSISHNSIRQIFQSSNGIIWFGTWSGGVNYYDPKSQTISHFRKRHNDENSLNINIVSFIYENKDKKLWIGTEYGGINIFDPEERSFRVLKNEPGKNSLINDNIKNIMQDQAGRYFIATQFGVSIYNPLTGIYTNIDDKPSVRGRLGYHIVHGLCMDRSGNIWLGTAGMTGQCYFHMYDVKHDTIHHFIPGPDDFPWQKDMTVHTMISDLEQNIIWSGGSKGLAGFNLNTKNYLNDSLFYPTAKAMKDIYINDLFLDNNGLIWIATFGRGIYLMDVRTYQLKKVKGAGGMQGSSFYALTSDEEGNMWASANSHLLKIGVPENLDDSVMNVEKYDIQEGFPAQQYFKNAACRGADGTLYFGGDNGFISFHPGDVDNRIFHPTVAILDILVNGESIEIQSDKEDQYINIASQKNVSLNHKQSSFSVQFIAPNFINPENTWYQYQLSGEDGSWLDLGTSNAIHFTKLKARSYELRLRASSDPDDFTGEITSITLQMAPPPWGSPLAYFIYLVIILGLLYLFFMISRKWERLRQNLRFELLQKEQEKEFNQRRLKFFTDISHELRTPLTLILAPLERIVQSNFGSAKIKNQLMLMLRNGDRMLQLINQLLDIRRLETGHIQLKAAKGNIAVFIKEVSLSFRELAQDRNIEFRVDSSDKKIRIWFDRDKFEIILYNLLSNAIKFTPDQGKIGVTVELVNDEETEDSGYVQIQIENTGKGIPKEHIDHIFDRFYTGPDMEEHKKSGTGVGLEIVRNLVDLHHGDISVESSYDEKGLDGQTRFIIKLKCGKAHYAKNELLQEYKSSEDISHYKKSALSFDGKKLSTTNDAGTTEELKEESVLIIEDNHEIRELVAGIFIEQYNTYMADNGENGLKIARDKFPDLIISDIVMPGIDGIELCRRIKTDVNTSHIPVILLTARTAVTFRYEGLETGADDYIVKPFNVEDLRLRSINLIRQRKVLKERFAQSGFLLPTEISLTSVDEKLLQKSIDYITEHIGDKDLTVDRIAREAGMSRSNFYRKMKALTNLSAAEFLRKVKMEHAAQLLGTNKFRISEVISIIGFSDADYFRECFKSQFGMTPKAFIESQDK